MTAIPNFNTDRLRLRGILPSDIAFVRELITCGAVRRFLGGPIPIDRCEAAISAYFSLKNGKIVWLVETKEAQHPLGLISISQHRDGEDSELSYQFHPDAWGLGYAAEAAARVLDYALKELQLERLIAETQSANFASLRLLEKLGMKEVRRLHRFGAEQIIYAS